jgi:hypothetical protein
MLYLLNNIVPNMLGLIGVSNGRPRYFKGRGETPQPIILVNPSTLSTYTIGTSSYLAKSIFKPETVLKHKNKHYK